MKDPYRRLHALPPVARRLVLLEALQLCMDRPRPDGTIMIPARVLEELRALAVEAEDVDVLNALRLIHEHGKEVIE